MTITKNDPFQPAFIQIGEYKVRYRQHQHPNTSAPHLVLLNGFPQSIRMWQSAWPALSEYFNILAFDIPGFGLSPPPSHHMSPRKLGDVVIQIMDHFNIDKTHLVGPDVGVPISLAAVSQQPQRFESLNIFDGPGHYPPQMSPILNAVIRFKLVRWLAKGLNKKAVMKVNYQTAIKEGYHHYQPDEAAIAEYYQITHNEQAHRNSVDFFGSYQQDLPWIQSQLTQLKVPVLITWGKHDPFVLPGNAAFLANLIPNNKVVIFDNASHFSAEDAGDRYTDTLIHWCQNEYQC